MIGIRTIVVLIGSGLLFYSSSLAATIEEKKIEQLEKDIDEINERIDLNEFAATLNRVKFGLEFNTSMHNITTKDNIQGQKNAFGNHWMLGLYLNMDARINYYTRFTGRLSMTKAFGDLELNTPIISSLNAGRGVGGGSSLYVERAYVDLNLNKYTTLTLGRLPSTDGPGSTLRNASARMATYPALTINTLGDGIVLSLKPHTEAALRLGFSKVYQSLDIQGNNGDGSIFGVKDAADSNLVFGTFETTFLAKNFGKNVLLLTYVNFKNYTIPSIAIPNVVSETATKGKTQNIGDIEYVSIHFENDRLLGSGLSWFLTGSYYRGDNARDIRYTTNNQNETSEKIFAEKNAWAFHLGLRYDFGPYFKIGYEYFNSSQFWYAFSRASINDPFNFRNTRGNVNDIYAIWQLDLNQFFRLSYTRQKQDYQTPLIPIETNAVNRINQNIALAYILRF